MHELQKDYGRITDGNYGVLHHFYNYVYSVLRRSTLTFLWPLPYVYLDCQWISAYFEFSVSGLIS